MKMSGLTAKMELRKWSSSLMLAGQNPEMDQQWDRERQVVRQQAETSFKEVDTSALMQLYGLPISPVADDAAALSDMDIIPFLHGLSDRGDRHGNLHVVKPSLV